ncbi:MAG TPA: LytTR family DNA-binding domain-containing protein [Usitatibacter sp.]|nr:LytTR family DNA-binding domain-containing protein [Usitatibacter sp.]
MAEARVSVVVADDEPFARAGLRRMLAEFDWIDCVGEAASGPAAIEAIEKLRPDLVFLDIRMPGATGLQVLGRIAHRPRVVFTTAFAEHAVTAFELGALDYLLKPFGHERLAVAMERLRATLGTSQPPAAERLAETLAQGPLARLFVRAGHSIVPVAVADIAWFEAMGDYVVLHTPAGTHVLHVTLAQLEARLDERHFRRIHRAHLVNLDHVGAFRRLPGGALCAELRDGTRVPVSRAKARELRALAS